MKKLLLGLFLTVLTALCPASGWAQGLVHFNNRVPDATPPIDAPIFDTDGSNRLVGFDFVAQLYAGTNDTSLAPVGPVLAFGTGELAGYLAAFATANVPSHEHPGFVAAIPGVAPGGTASVQIRVWERTSGPNHAQAAANGGKHGASAILNITTGGAGDPPGPPANLTGLESFSLTQPAPTAPTITRQPVSQTVPLGAGAVFRVEATGTRPLRFQWRHNGTNLAGRTNSALNLERVTGDHAGAYDVVVSNSAGSTTSDAATLTVTVAPPVIVSQPMNQKAPLGANVAFRVMAKGSSPLRYQWRFNDTDLPRGTNSILWIERVQLENAGVYAVRVSNAAGSVTSSNATLMVITNHPPPPPPPTNVPPRILAQPRSVTLPVGGRAYFSVGAEGTRPLSYQWSFNGTDVVRGTNPVFIVENVQAADAGAYLAVVSNAAGSATSSPAMLIVTNPPPPPPPPTNVPPRILSQPMNQHVLAGSNAMFRVMAAGSPPLRFQWTFNGNPIERGSNSVLKIEHAQQSDAGVYAVTVSNHAGSATSSNATLTVITNLPPPPPPPTNYPPVIREQPRSLTAPIGANVAFTVIIGDGTRPLRYQWRFNGADISFGTNSTLWLNNVRVEQAGAYDAVVSNVAGSVTSAIATLTLTNPPPPPPPPTNYPPAIIGQPRSQTVPAGANVGFNIQVTGSGPLRFQWRFNGSNLPLNSLSGPTLWIERVTAAHAGAYDCVVSNPYGTVTSDAATLTVTNPPPPPPPAPPVILQQPFTATVNVGASLSLNVQFSGAGPLRFQWRFNGVNIERGTNASLGLSNVKTNDAGDYSVVISNAGGSVTSSPIALVVIVPPPPPPPQPPVIIRQPVSQTVPLGAGVSFRVEATGSGPLKFLWRFNGTNVHLILIRFQDETKHGRVSAWQDHVGWIHSS